MGAYIIFFHMWLLECKAFGQRLASAIRMDSILNDKNKDE